MVFQKLKWWVLALASGILGAFLGPILFGGSTAAAAGAGLGICTGIALAWILSNESLSAAWEQTARTFARVAFVLLVVTIV